MAEQASSAKYMPEDRSNVEKKSNQERPRKYGNGEKRRLKNKHGIFEYDVTIVSAEYDTWRHTWMYTLEDWEGLPIDGEWAETKLG